MYSEILEIVEKSMAANLNLEIRQARLRSLTELELAAGLILPMDACLLCGSLEKKLLKVGDRTYVLQKPLQAGDLVIVLRIGDSYLIVDRVGDLKNVQSIT